MTRNIIISNQLYIFFVYPMLLVSLVSCTLQKGVVIYEEQEGELVSSAKIKEFFKPQPQPSIVLEVPESSPETNFRTMVYNAIEKELVLAGFNVIDWRVYNKLVDSENTSINKVTDSLIDLIFQIVNFDNHLEYTTNQIYTKTGNLKESNSRTVTKLGGEFEFKLIFARTSSYGGSYSFYYVPCTADNPTQALSKAECKCNVAYKEPFPNKIYPNYNYCKKDFDPSKSIPSDEEMINLVRRGVSEMVEELKP